MKMKEEQIISVLDGRISDAVINQGRFIADNVESLRRYKAMPYGNEVEGRSSFVSNDAKDLVTSDLVSLVRVFLGSNSVIRFTPNNPDDQIQVEEAEEKTKYVDWLVRSQKDSFKTLYDFLFDIEVQKMGVIKYFYEETTEVEEHEYTGLSAIEIDAEMQALMQGSGKREVIIKSHKEIPSTEGGEINSTFDIKLKVEITRQTINIVTIPCENFLISENASSKEEAELIGDTSLKTRGQLIAEGVSKKLVAKLPIANALATNKTEMLNVRFSDEGGIHDDNYASWASETVEIEDLYTKLDVDGDGIAERRNIQKCGNYIISNMPFNHVPYAMASALPIAHKAIGEGRAEQVAGVAENKSAITRNMLDNSFMHNNPKIGVNDDGNLDDALSRAIGGVYRTKGSANPAQTFAPFQIPFIGDKALLVLQTLEQNKAATVGQQMASQGLQADDIANETATRFNGVAEESKGKIELVARCIAEGFRQLYEGVAWLANKHQSDELEFAVLGKGMTTTPAKWKYDNIVTSEVGLGAGDNAKVVETMTGIYRIQTQLKAEGSPLVDDVKVYNTLDKLTSATEIKDTSLYFNNPEEPAEQLKYDNEQLNQLAMQQQEQIKLLEQQLANPLAEAEMVKREGDIAIAQGKLRLDAAKLKEDGRQFNIETMQKEQKQDDDLALEITKIEQANNVQLEGGID